MRFVMYDDITFEVYGAHIRVNLSERKTHVYGSQGIDIARPADGRLGVCDVLLLGKRVFGGGHVLPHSGANGRAHCELPMEYDVFVAHLRQARVSTGLSEAEVFEYTAHSIWSGAATEAVHAGLLPLLICGVACVKSIDWLVGYMRADSGDRLRASRSLGL